MNKEDFEINFRKFFDFVQKTFFYDESEQSAAKCGVNETCRVVM